MSGFTESGFERKLAELNSTQVSIQTLSMWLIHHRKHHPVIVKVWYKEFLKAQEHRKLTFVYLANDVIQNSRKKGGEFGKSFGPVFKKALEYMARNPDDKIKKNILRILRIWEERGIYEPTLIRDFESSYRKAWDDLHGPDVDELLDGITTPPEKKDSSSTEASPSKAKPTSSKSEGRKRHSHSSAEGGRSGHSSSEHRHHKKRQRTKREEIEQALRKRSLEDTTNTIEEWEVDGVTQIEIKLSPSPYKDPPTEEELIAVVKSLDKMPSTDAVTRGKIATLPPEVSDAKGVDSICVDSDVSRDLQKKINTAHDILKDYNTKLDAELDDRKSASMKLQDLIGFQKDLLTQAEHRLEEHQNYGKILSKKLDELKAHVLSMPDLSKLPSVTDGLAPLPSAGDLFNI